MKHPTCVGTVLSCWGEDRRLLDEQLTHPGASMLTDCMRRGIPRTSIGHYGMNAYSNMRFSTAYVATPMEAVEDKVRLQMHRAEFAEHGMRPQLIRVCHALETEGLEGQSPVSQPPQKKQKYNNSQCLETRKPHSPRQLVYGFCNTSHIDSKDQLTALQQKELHMRAADFGLDPQKYPGLPTTCAWQFVFRHDNAADKLTIHQHFIMHGLGVAMPIRHGLGHHFYGGIFEHNTSLCLVQRKLDGFVSLTNDEDHFMLFAWGNSPKIPKREIQLLLQEAAVPLVVDGQVVPGNDTAVPAADLPPPPA
ncbi:expressed unknown protein [Seminavis robusta]|uniref:Uncharacterized protein n=1 Tax=Seminavis robusta TaxID=568900 RepID=A0A9N8EKQ7_9STRA|nr:expressed unknown protein [Seminavis robusta]|eukprot:Sro1142_g245850.1 n/a (306) ;mRNA; r:28487-29497